MALDRTFRTAEKKIEEAGGQEAQELDLSGLELAGLPESLGRLSQLQSLDLSDNKLTTLPKWLGQLTQLQSLNLCNNELAALPESPGQITRLQSLDLSDNKLTTLPKWLGQLTQLQSLNLSENKLTAVPDSLCQLAKLQWLDLSGNLLATLPEWLGQLTQLHWLNLSDNELTALPEPLGQLTHLQLLDLSKNKLTALPEALGQLTHLQSLNLSENRLTALPEALGQLTHLQSLDLSGNKLTAVPDSLCQIAKLQSLALSDNGLTALPESLGRLTQLRSLDLTRNRLTALPDSLGRLMRLQSLYLAENKLTVLPNSIGNIKQLTSLLVEDNLLDIFPSSVRNLTLLKDLRLTGNRLRSVPAWIGDLNALTILEIGECELTELPDSVARLASLTDLYLGVDAKSDKRRNRFENFPICVRSLANLEVLWVDGCDFNLLPEWLGELVGLHSLSLASNELTDLPASLGALPKLQRVSLANNPLNPELAAAYSEGLDSVKRYLRAKAEAQVSLNEAKLILVGEGEVGKSSLLGALRGDPWVEGNPTTHGIEIKSVKVAAPNAGVEIMLNAWDFGGQRVYRPTHQLFFSAPAIYLVVWKPREGPQQGFVKEWITLIKHRAPEAKIFVVATHGGPKQRQPDLDRQEIWDVFGKNMVLDFFLVESKPDKKSKKRKGIDELKKAIARAATNLPEMGRKVPKRWENVRQALKTNGAAYLPLEQVLRICRDHELDDDEANDFVRISHRLGHLIHYEHDPLLRDVVVLKPDWLSTAVSFVLDDEQTRKAHGLVSADRLTQLWNDPKRPKNRYPANLHTIFLRLMERYDLSYRVAEPNKNQQDGTSLIAQLVPDVRPPERELSSVWPPDIGDGDEQQVQICRIVDAKTGQSATAEGLFFQLIVRLHKYSLGRVNYDESVHWQRGLVLDDEYNGRAMLENIGNDVRIAVRAAYPERFLSVLTHEVKWLVESFWQGLRCEGMGPCMAPCAKGAPGIGLFEVEKLIAFKRQMLQQFPCIVTGCNQLQNIDSLLRNAPGARRTPIEMLLAQGFDQIRLRLDGVREQLFQQDRQAQNRFTALDQNDRRLMSQVEDAYTGLMQSLTDEAKDGPRLFSFEAVDKRFFERPKWISAKFRLTLWCEHSRLPLPALNKKGDMSGVYELNLPREWLVKAMPYLKVLTGVLSLVVPVVASAAKLELDEATYKGIEKQLDFGQKSLESALKGSEKVEDRVAEGDAAELEHGRAIRARGAALRQLHTILKEKDSTFGGLVRVQNRRREFLWVHPKFAGEY